MLTGLERFHCVIVTLTESMCHGSSHVFLHTCSITFMHVYLCTMYVFLQNYYGVLRVYLSTESLPSESPSPSHTPSNDDSNDDSNNDGETVLFVRFHYLFFFC